MHFLSLIRTSCILRLYSILYFPCFVKLGSVLLFRVFCVYSIHWAFRVFRVHFVFYVICFVHILSVLIVVGLSLLHCELYLVTRDLGLGVFTENIQFEVTRTEIE